MSHFTDEEIEAQRGSVTCPGSQSNQRPRQDVNQQGGSRLQALYPVLLASFGLI